MDILNELPEEQFNEVDDLLAFVSIYDDDNRTRAYFSLLEKNIARIRGQVCLEAGCGFGLMAERLAQLGAKKVYAVEANRHLYDLAKQRLEKYENVEIIQSDIRDFSPTEEISLLVHEFFGQLLFDEDIYVLDQLAFIPKTILPNSAFLKMSVLSSQDYLDENVTASVLQKLNGVLVSGLFEDEEVRPEQTILEWRPGKKNLRALVDVRHFSGDLLCFGLEVFHENSFVCRAGECDNWSLVWTPNAGDLFELKFEPVSRGTNVEFNWLV